MGIRKWFGFEAGDKSMHEVDNCLDELLTLYAKGIGQYFGLEPTKFTNVIHMVTSLLSSETLDPVDNTFLLWLQDKGIPNIISLIKRTLPKDSDLIAEIRFEIYNLEDEIGYNDNEDLRSCLINIVCYMPDRITRIETRSIMHDQYSLPKQAKEGKKDPYIEVSGVGIYTGSLFIIKGEV